MHQLFSRLNPLLLWIRTNRIDLLVLLFFILFACAWWWPLPLHLLSGQTEWPVIDPAFNQWILAWDAHALTNYPWKFFDANMFYPFPQTLAWGDHLFSLALFATPLIPLIGVAGAYNVLLIGSSAFSAFTAYLLCNHLLKNRGASLVAGLMWGFTYYRFTEGGHIQILFTQWIPLVFLFAEKIRTQYSRKNFFLFTLFTFLMLATNLYLAMFTVMSFALYFIALAFGKLINRKTALRVLLGWIIAGVLTLPLYLPSIILQLQHPLVRGYDNQASIFLHGLLPWPWPGHVIRFLAHYFNKPIIGDPTFHSPGVLTYGFLLLGIVFLIKKRRQTAQKRIAIAFLVVGIIAILAGAGPVLRWYETIITPANPFYTVPYHFMPGYNALRTPMRWFLLAMLGFSFFSAWTIAQIHIKSRVLQAFLLSIFAIFIFIEQSPAPIKTHPQYSIKDYPAYQWMQSQPEEYAILELPIYPGTSTRVNDIIEARRMYLSTFHWKKRVSGAITPYIPHEYVENAQILNAIGDNSQAMQMLKDWHIKYIIFLPEDFDILGWSDSKESVKQKLGRLPDLKKVQEYSNATIYEIIY